MGQSQDELLRTHIVNQHQILKKAGTNRKKFKAKFKAFSNKAEGTHELHCQSPTPPFFSFNFFESVSQT